VVWLSENKKVILFGYNHSLKKYYSCDVNTN
jgi:hypothetical protein